jgi:hypothetical protein
MIIPQTFCFSVILEVKKVPENFFALSGSFVHGVLPYFVVIVLSI